MSFLSTGPIENNAVGGLRPTQQVTVKIDNRSDTMSSLVTVEGYYLDGTRTLYVSETLNVLPNQVVTTTYYADLDAFEFVFVTSGTIDEQVQVSVWGKNSSGGLVTPHRLVSAELLGTTTGEAGATGVTGATGATGTSPAGLSEYAYIYNTAAQTVPLEADVTFSNNGPIIGAITYTAGSSVIPIGTAGDYAVWFNATGVEPNQFSLFQNGTSVAGGIYGSCAGTQANPGMVIVVAAAGDSLTLRNHSSSAAITLQTLSGGTQVNANASILIQKIN